jgi:hypothetical protein
MPAQRPGRSEQVVATPRNFLITVEQKFGPIAFDLAANAENAVTNRDGQIGDYFGPGSIAGPDALALTWPACGLNWLNPPFGDIRPWAEKCVAEAARGARTLLLVPASVGAEWFGVLREHAFIFELSPRITFVGHTGPYPKDLVLAYFGPEGFVGRAHWRWKP